MPNVLLISIDSPMIGAITGHLDVAGYSVGLGSSAARAALLRAESVALVVIDLHAASAEAHRFLRQLRSEFESTMILAIGDGDTEADVVLALRSGADRYAAKPLGFDELIARIDSLLRRVKAVEATGAVNGIVVAWPARSPRAARRLVLRSLTLRDGNRRSKKSGPNLDTGRAQQNQPGENCCEGR